jgi:diaminohydroxyphosphoribosylaminopyrimidine deaminase/5-amino-6-(5-phosphoribosylamino)uracil reductase
MDFMARALCLARLALGHASPNPAVGAVIVRDNVIVGEGYTQPPGSWHAEVVALQQAGAAARGAKMFVTLEPCCHFGRTPPCTQAIIAAGITEVHCATLDPNPAVNGQGRAELEAAGVKTFLGEHREEAEELNEAYSKFITVGLPFVIAKFAMSLDGKIATRTGESRWISGQESRRFVHCLRHTIDALMVGVNTILMDNPQLTARIGRDGGRTERQPLRVIVDSKGRSPVDARVFQAPGKALLAVAYPLDPVKRRALTETGVEVLEFPPREGRVDLLELLQALAKRNITSVLVEGGGTLLASFFEQRLVDKVLAFIAPIIIGGKEAKTPVAGKGVERIAQALRLSRIRLERLGEDMLICGYVTSEPGISTTSE